MSRSTRSFGTGIRYGDCGGREKLYAVKRDALLISAALEWLAKSAILGEVFCACSAGL